jgi:hypothetical protein
MHQTEGALTLMTFAVGEFIHTRYIFMALYQWLFALYKH